MRKPEREQDGLTPAEKQLAAAMGALRPAPAALRRDWLLFEAGAAVGRARARRSVTIWRAATAVIALALGASWAWRDAARPGTAGPRERVVYAERDAGGAANLLDDPEYDNDDTASGQYAATRAGPFSQSFARADDGYLALRGAVTARGVNAVRDVRAAFSSAQAPTTRTDAQRLPAS